MSASQRPASPDPVRILIADDDEMTRAQVSACLSQYGFEVEAVPDAAAALSRARDGRFHVVLLDVVMPGMTGLDACRLIKGMTQDRFLPVALLTARSDVDSRVEGLRVGADEYICKPFDDRELYERVHSLLRIKQSYDAVAHARDELSRVAVRDELTGLYNYRYLQSRLSEEFKRAERYREPLACVMLDLDNFKTINDSLGHAIGDEVVKETAARLLRTIRDVDVAARYGGDEFLLILPSSNFPGALTLAERVLRAIGEVPYGAGDEAFMLTASIGVSVFPSRDIHSKDGLLKAADRALYEAKQNGRNRICVFQHQGYSYRPSAFPNVD